MNEKDRCEYFSKQLKKLLDKRDITMTKLAEDMNVSVQTISRWCKGEVVPSMKKIDWLCEYFRCDKGVLLLELRDYMLQMEQEAVYEEERQKELELQYSEFAKYEKERREIYSRNTDYDFIVSREDIEILVELAKKSSVEDVLTAYSVLLALKKKEQRNKPRGEQQ